MTAEDSILQMSDRYSLSTSCPALTGQNIAVHLRKTFVLERNQWSVAYRGWQLTVQTNVPLGRKGGTPFPLGLTGPTHGHPSHSPWSSRPPRLCAPGATFTGGPTQPSGIPEICQSGGIDQNHRGLPSVPPAVGPAVEPPVPRGQPQKRCRPPERAGERQCPSLLFPIGQGFGKGGQQSLSDSPRVASFTGTAAFPCAARLQQTPKAPWAGSGFIMFTNRVEAQSSSVDRLRPEGISQQVGA